MNSEWNRRHPRRRGLPDREPIGETVETMERDHRAMEQLRMLNSIWTYRPGELQGWDRTYHEHGMGKEYDDPADAILGPSKGEDDE